MLGLACRTGMGTQPGCGSSEAHLGCARSDQNASLSRKASISPSSQTGIWPLYLLLWGLLPLGSGTYRQIAPFISCFYFLYTCMAGWHHWLYGCESEWTPGVGDEQGGLACCDSWGHKESDTTEWLNWTELTEIVSTNNTVHGWKLDANIILRAI